MCSNIHSLAMNELYNQDTKNSGTQGLIIVALEHNYETAEEIREFLLGYKVRIPIDRVRRILKELETQGKVIIKPDPKNMLYNNYFLA